MTVPRMYMSICNAFSRRMDWTFLFVGVLTSVLSPTFKGFEISLIFEQVL